MAFNRILSTGAYRPKKVLLSFGESMQRTKGLADSVCHWSRWEIDRFSFVRAFFDMVPYR